MLGIELTWDHVQPYSFTLAAITSCLWLFPDFRRFPSQLIDIIDVRSPQGTTPPLSERCWDAVSNVGLPQLWVRLVLRVRSGGIWKGASFQVRPTHVSMRFASVVTGLGMA